MAIMTNTNLGNRNRNEQWAHASRVPEATASRIVPSSSNNLLPY